MRREFIDFYDKNVDDLFSYYYERTLDRGQSIDLAKDVFTKTWDTVNRGNASIISEEGDVRKNEQKKVVRRYLTLNSQFGY